MFTIITDYCITSINHYSTLATIINHASPLLITITEGSLEAKLPTIWTDGKAEVGRVRERRKEKRREEKRREGKGREGKGREGKRREEKGKSQKKEDAGARKGRKVAIRCVFKWAVAPESRKVGSLKRRVRSHVARWEMKSCTPLWREAHLQVKKLKTPHATTTTTTTTSTLQLQIQI